MTDDIILDELVSAALLLADGGSVIEWPDESHGGHALAYAAAGWQVFPLHPYDCNCPGTRTRPGCATNEKARGKVPHTVHGVLDATTDLDQVAAWWTRWPNANIGGRLPAGVIAIDIDPRSGGLETWAAIVAEHGDIETRTAISGRGDGGRHLYVNHPGGTIKAGLGAGIDIKTHGGYTVLPPSIHAATGNRYQWHDVMAPIIAPPTWLASMLRPVVVAKVSTARTPSRYVGDSIADWYSTMHTWAQVLEPHGWTLISGDGDERGSQWRHPTATSPFSATIRTCCLFVYSPNTAFGDTNSITTAGNPHGFTKFRAFAVLDHGGDLSAAALAARSLHTARGAA